jgi:hypothetical protein
MRYPGKAGTNSMTAESGQAESGKQDYSLTGLLDEVRSDAEDGEVSISEVVSTFSHQAYGPLLLIPSLIALTPVIGAIPGISIITGVMIILVAAQMIVGRSHPWLPQWVSRRSLTRKQVEKGIAYIGPYLKAMDRYTRPRLLWLTQQPLLMIVPTVCILLSLLMFPLALVPWGVTLPALALTILSVGLTLRDGYLLAAGYAVTVISVLSALWMV